MLQLRRNVNVVRVFLRGGLRRIHRVLLRRIVRSRRRVVIGRIIRRSITVREGNAGSKSEPKPRAEAKSCAKEEWIAIEAVEETVRIDEHMVVVEMMSREESIGYDHARRRDHASTGSGDD